MTMNVTLNNGVQLPALGFGVFQTPPDVTAQAVATALATGYRLIDTAAAYGNEREVGQAIRGSGLARDEVFIETKTSAADAISPRETPASPRSRKRLEAAARMAARVDRPASRVARCAERGLSWPRWSCAAASPSVAMPIIVPLAAVPG
jgi:aryl-alcohol dehydrogenase-like predicted oxidoreductase